MLLPCALVLLPLPSTCTLVLVLLPCALVLLPLPSTCALVLLPSTCTLVLVLLPCTLVLVLLPYTASTSSTASTGSTSCLIEGGNCHCRYAHTGHPLATVSQSTTTRNIFAYLTT